MAADSGEPQGRNGPQKDSSSRPVGQNGRVTLSAPRLTHVALPVGDLDASVEWYERYTPLVCIHRRADHIGQAAWLSHDRQVDNPFVIVLVMNFSDGGQRHPVLTPFAHLGIEVPTRSDVDDAADVARAAGCLAWEPADLPEPVGYICALHDPDGNVIEISHNQGVYAAVQEMWGS